VVLRRATEDDMRDIHELHARSVRGLWLSHYATEQIEGWLKGREPEGYIPAIRNGDMFVVEEEGTLLGFGHVEDEAVLAIFVDPDAAGRGVGSLLLAHAVQEAVSDHGRPVHLTATLNAEGFYRRFGFEPVERKALAKGGIEFPVVVMELPERRHE